MALVGVVALLASACGFTRDSAGTAATVNLKNDKSVDIAGSELASVIGSVTSNADFVNGAFSGVVPDGIDAQLLTTMVVEVVIDEILAEEGLEMDEALHADSLSFFESELSSLIPDADKSAQAFSDLNPYLDLLSRTRAKQETLGNFLAENQGEAEVLEIPCASHILVDTEGEADDLVAQLEGGADFAELAIEFSLDPGSGANGGVLGCTPTASFVPEFRDAIDNGTEGELLGPVQTDFGFHLIIITGYDAQPQAQPSANDLASVVISDYLSAMPDVDVDPTIGTWDITTLTVAPAVDEPGQ